MLTVDTLIPPSITSLSRSFSSRNLPILPPPSALGMPPQFSSWYPHQDAALSWILDRLASDSPSQRHIAVSAPTGSGKTVLAALSGLLSGRRTVILTATKALQDQYRDTLRGLPLADLRGKNSYGCTLDPSVSAEHGPCNIGVHCPYKEDGCLYQSSLLAARSPFTRLVLTNYTCWMTQQKYGGGMGEFGLLVLDEAHQAYDSLSDFLQVEFSSDEIESVGSALPDSDEPLEWKSWAADLAILVAEMYDEQKEQARWKQELGQSSNASLTRAINRLAGILSRLKVISSLQGRWLVDRGDGDGVSSSSPPPPSRKVTLAPVWPAEYAEGTLLHNIPKALFLSATLRPKTVELLGITPDTYVFGDVPSTFPAAHRLVIHIPTARMNHRAGEYEWGIWAARIDQIIASRQDRKGLIHTVSYRRRDYIIRNSRFQPIMFSHSSRDIANAVFRFKRASPPAVMISPSLTAGYDFPLDDCEYIVIGKVPYPDPRSPIIRARTKGDKDWAAYTAMQTLVQAAGRGVRSATDRCEIFIIDDDWLWFWKRYRQFAPEWFQEAVRFQPIIPQPFPRVLGTNLS